MPEGEGRGSAAASGEGRSRASFFCASLIFANGLLKGAGFFDIVSLTYRAPSFPLRPADSAIPIDFLDPALALPSWSAMKDSTGSLTGHLATSDHELPPDHDVGDTVWELP